ncbi:hypothetical protein GACE_0176 [Geoglobus acetivorans]|uniref:Uncharacterized protein n=2 Tax=Geoglobus acetivorans TaxID=565033 RepID=A0A0A7GBL7_GEOAI|nr:hypothetical protein GACE_0176 [Geoglobus acetivorans]
MLLILVAAFANSWQLLGYLVGFSLSLWLVIGAMRENEFGPALPLGITLFVFWTVCITLIFKYWAEFRGKFPDFTIAGMHPGFFVLFPLMWLLLFIPGTLSYALLFDRWILSEETWNEFKMKVKGSGGEGNE